MRPGRSSERDSRGVGGSGRATAPVGRVSGSALVFPSDRLGCDGSDGSLGRGSRPRKTRDRLRSSSNATPGVRSVAPVGRSGTSRTGAPTSRPRRGKSARSGSDSTTRRAICSSAGWPRLSELPKSLRGTLVTPRHVLSYPCRSSRPSRGRP